MKINILTILAIVSCVASSCHTGYLNHLRFILEYSLWKGWQQTLLIDVEQKQSCKYAFVKLMKCFAVNGVGTSVKLPSAETIQQRLDVKSRLGIVMLPVSTTRNSTFTKLQKLVWNLHSMKFNSASYDWLITARSDKDLNNIHKILNLTSIRFDGHMAVSYLYRNENHQNIGLCDYNFNSTNVDNTIFIPPKCRYKNDPLCTNIKYEDKYFKTTGRFHNLLNNMTYKNGGKLLPLYNSGLMDYNYSRPFVMSNLGKLEKSSLNKWLKTEIIKDDGEIIVVQYFKVRENSTLYGYILGTWSRKNSMSNVLAPYPVEARNFLGEELVIGRSNITDRTYSEEEEPAAPSQLDDIMHYLSKRLNFTPSVRHFSKLGYQTYQGGWTGLLGALVDSSLDMVLEPVTTYVQKHEAMEFLIPVADTMCNIYIRHQETSTARDIFLAPFSSRLIGCVFLIVVASGATILIISRLLLVKRRQEHAMEYMEAFLWSAGILFQQGGCNTPPCSAGRLALIACLLFAVVIYNAYAAFITSVLSVRVASLDTIDAVLQSSNTKIGYIKNGADQNYLMSTKDVQLNAFYIRGYSNAENLVTSAQEGLERAVNHDYAFFAGQRTARFTLLSISQEKGRCALRELALPTTKAHLSFPIARKSPYARLILINLLQLKTSGSLKRLESALVPPMPFCDPPKGFTSARATDVRSALILIGVGLMASLIIGIIEYCWKKKSTHKRRIRRVFRHFKALLDLDFE